MNGIKAAAVPAQRAIILKEEKKEREKEGKGSESGGTRKVSEGLHCCPNINGQWSHELRLDSHTTFIYIHLDRRICKKCDVMPL